MKDRAGRGIPQERARRAIPGVGTLLCRRKFPLKPKADGIGRITDGAAGESGHDLRCRPVKNYLPARGRAFGSEKYALGPDGFRAAIESLGQEASKGLTDAIGFSEWGGGDAGRLSRNMEAEC